MSTLKQLSAIYIAAASTYAVAIVLAQHPIWALGARIAAHYMAEEGEAAAVALDDHVLKPGFALARDEAGRAYRALVEAMTAPPVHVAAKKSPAPNAKPVIAKAEPHAKQIAIEHRTVTAWSRPVAHAPQASVTLDIAPPQKAAAPPMPPPTDNAPGPAQIARVAQHLRDDLTREMFANFDLFLYVSKAEKGPLAQRMYVFAKQSSGDLALRYDWSVSTGREKIELSPNGLRLVTDTPEGYYEIDPKRVYRDYTSHQWRKPMPYAMFFNWVHDGSKTGLAIHAAYGDDVALLGSRASGGCIHLSPQNAAVLFDLIRTQYRGEVPRLAYDEKTATASNRGQFLYDANGHLRYAKGYRVLVVIENYGGENVVAALM